MILSVCGTQRNVGVTYFCLALSNYLCNMEQRQVAYLEVNATGEISAISGKSALQPGKPISPIREFTFIHRSPWTSSGNYQDFLTTFLSWILAPYHHSRFGNTSRQTTTLSLDTAHHGNWSTIIIFFKNTNIIGNRKKPYVWKPWVLKRAYVNPQTSFHSMYVKFLFWRIRFILPPRIGNFIRSW